MWSSSPSQHLQTKSAIALALTLAAGFVDIVGYISLHNVFTAHMTGETVHLAQNLLQRDWFEVAAAGCVIGAFLLGSIVGRTIIEIGWRTGTRTIASATLLLELILIALVFRSPKYISTVAAPWHCLRFSRLPWEYRQQR